jgi:hypothetical protein
MPLSPAGIGNRTPPMKFRSSTFTTRILLAGLQLVLMSILASPANANYIELTAEVDNNKISMEDSIQLSLTIIGVVNSPEPQLPPLPNFRIRSLSTSSSTKIINGKRDVSITHNYQLTPLKTGTLIIKPAILELAGITYRSKPITISVSKGSPRQKTTSLAYVEAFISNANPYVNEQVINTFRLYRRVEARNLDLRMSYEDRDFRKEEMGDAKTYSRMINGIQYRIHELSTALYPIHSGNVEISPAVLELNLLDRSGDAPRRNPFSGFFNNGIFGAQASWVHKTLRSQPIPIQVRPLPKKGKPDNFSNIVGNLTLAAIIGKEELDVGDTTTLTVTVKGPGSVKDFSLSLPEMEEHFKVYPDQPESQLSVRENTLTGEKIFKFALVPLKAGNNTLPSITLPYFDPARKKYLIAKTTPIALTILPSGDQENINLTESFPEQKNGTKNSVQITGEDILPIHTRLADFENNWVKGSNAILFTGSVITPPALFLLFTAYTRYNQRLKYDTAFVRNRKAFKVAHQKLKHLSASPGPNSREFAKILSEIFREYIGNKLNVQGKAITSLEVEHKLMDRHYPEDQVEQTRTLLEKYESLQYAPTADLTNNNDLIDESLELLNQLEKKA